MEELGRREDERSETIGVGSAQVIQCLLFGRGKLSEVDIGSQNRVAVIGQVVA
jgi:hypothetical protein